MQTITLPLETVRDLIFGFDQYWGIKPSSFIRNDSMIPPVIVPKQLGKILDELNSLYTDTKPFHIIHYEQHTEVWSYEHWRLSDSKRWHQALHSEERARIHNEANLLANRIQAKRQAIKEILVNTMSYMNRKDQTIPLSKMIDFFMSSPPKEFCDQIPGMTEVVYGNN